MCNNNCNCRGSSRCNSCIADILRVICVIQQKTEEEECLITCDRPKLGCDEKKCVPCNTRPVMLFTCGCCNTPLCMPVSRDFDSIGNCSEVFRVEKIKDCCATLRVLVPNPEGNRKDRFIATDSTFTIDINCICIIKCLEDTFVEGI